MIKIQKPSFVQVGSNHLIYTIKKGRDGRKGVAVYKIGHDVNDAQLISEQLFDGPSPAYIGLDEDRAKLAREFGATDYDRHVLLGAVWRGKFPPEKSLPNDLNLMISKRLMKQWINVMLLSRW